MSSLPFRHGAVSSLLDDQSLPRVLTEGGQPQSQHTDDMDQDKEGVTALSRHTIETASDQGE